MRTLQVARLSGCSTQQVHKLESAGVLPPVPRSASGYRRYDARHVTSLLAYRALADALGPVEARELMQEVHRDLVATLSRLDAAHARLHQERVELALARRAVLDIGTEPMTLVAPTDSMTIGELAVALGIRPSTLRHWEAERLLAPPRSRHGARSYRPVDVRDARLIHQLRQAGHRIGPLRDLLPTLRGARDWEALLAGREESVTARSLALLRGGSLLAEVAHVTAVTRVT